MNKMLIKLTCIVVLSAVNGVVLASNEALLKVGVGFDQGFGVTAQYADQINVFIGNDGLSADRLLRMGYFSYDSSLNWYVGVGGAINWKNDNEYSARVPLGLNFPLTDGWNVYGQVAPNLKYIDKSSDEEFKFGADFAIGIRYAF